MSSYNLTDNQKNIIRWIIQEIRNQNLTEEFLVDFTFNGAGITRYHGQSPLPDISRRVLDALESAKLIICKPLDRTTYIAVLK